MPPTAAIGPRREVKSTGRAPPALETAAAAPVAVAGPFRTTEGGGTSRPPTGRAVVARRSPVSASISSRKRLVQEVREVEGRRRVRTREEELAELAPQIAARLVARLRGRQRGPQDRQDLGGKTGGGGAPATPLTSASGSGGARLARQQLEEDDADRIDVGASPDLAAVPLLGSEVRRDLGGEARPARIDGRTPGRRGRSPRDGFRRRRRSRRNRARRGRGACGRRRSSCCRHGRAPSRSSRRSGARARPEGAAGPPRHLAISASSVRPFGCCHAMYGTPSTASMSTPRAMAACFRNSWTSPFSSIASRIGSAESSSDSSTRRSTNGRSSDDPHARDRRCRAHRFRGPR